MSTWIKAKKFVGWKFGHNMSNLFDGFMHNCDLVWWAKKPHLNWTC